MDYYDSVYGKSSINEPVLTDLMHTKAFECLGHVLQHGITGFLNITKPVTRQQHSVGVMLLTRFLEASLKEQIAALLHDVGHTAFSHVTDHVFSGPNGESYHEFMKEPFLKQSDIPPVLKRHGHDWRDFIHEEPYPVLEQGRNNLNGQSHC